QLQERIANQLQIYPQEKIHLHIDRSYYVPGERIWFKAYLADAFTHQSITDNHPVYVEMKNDADSLVHRVILAPTEGMYHGHIQLSGELKEGTYTLIAYTRYMENPDQDYYFRKNIRIGSLRPEKQKVAADPQTDYTVSFYPEGGYLLEGAECRVAFKALNEKGASENIKGLILTEEGDTLNSVTTIHAGMGIIFQKPQRGKRFFLACENSAGLKKRFELPEAVPDMCGLIVNMHSGKVFVSLNHAPGYTPNGPLYLLLHTKGIVHYFAEYDIQKPFYSFLQTEMPTGVQQVLLLDENMHPLSERLIFTEGDDYASLQMQADKESYGTREKVTTEITLKDNKGVPLTGHLSVAVTDNRDVEVDKSVSILTSLLLSSELKGYIENPGYYFTEKDRITTNTLDLLMMVNGWRRYDIPRAIQGEYSYSPNLRETGLSLSGKIKSLFSGRGIAKGKVAVIASHPSRQISYFDEVEANENGQFYLGPFNLPDSTSFFAQAVNAKDRGGVELVMDSILYPLTTSIVPPSPKPLPKEIEESFVEKATQRAKYDEDMQMIYLKEIEVKATRITKEDRYVSTYFSDFAVAVTQEEIERKHPIHLHQILEGVSGVAIGPTGKISIRGASAEPLFLYDGSPIESDALDAINVHDIARVEIFKGPEAAIFGVRASGGAIQFISKKGEMGII
ncbi:TonB-dependent receptor plug domain-containing protein, partial [Parabacteroides sp. OttesenSCG-928-K15]|nr:TonB-dependent receptor plug domain-containing protein [Parabacteroides sp. OttesenSCG-928-K15]